MAVDSVADRTCQIGGLLHIVLTRDASSGSLSEPLFFARRVVSAPGNRFVWFLMQSSAQRGFAALAGVGFLVRTWSLGSESTRVVGDNMSRRGMHPSLMKCNQAENKSSVQAGLSGYESAQRKRFLRSEQEQVSGDSEDNDKAA